MKATQAFCWKILRRFLLSKNLNCFNIMHLFFCVISFFLHFFLWQSLLVFAEWRTMEMDSQEPNILHRSMVPKRIKLTVRSFSRSVFVDFLLYVSYSYFLSVIFRQVPVAMETSVPVLTTLQHFHQQ